MTFLELAEAILATVQKPMSSAEIWRCAENMGYSEDLASQGKTPGNTLAAQLHVSVRDNPNSPFVCMGSRPKKFYLKRLNYTKEDLLAEDLEVSPASASNARYLEKDLHAVLSYFIYYYMKAFAKTLDHRKSTKKQFGEWVHPDVVACQFAFEEWDSAVTGLSMAMKESPVYLMSFEIKRELHFGNLRESFFQAVSNSSWAHEAYLVTAEMSPDNDFYEELERLSGAFGVGVIVLNLADPEDTEIVFDAEEREFLDWETINKLSINPDFKEFLVRVKKDTETQEIRKECYDKIETREHLINFFKTLSSRKSRKPA